MMPHRFRLLLLTVTMFGQQHLAKATFFDFHNLGNINAAQKSLTVDGITVRLSASSGKLVSTSSRFGIDGSAPTDVPDLVDGGNGTAEVLGFIFNNSFVVLDSILISQFDGDDAGIVNIKAKGAFPLTNGENLFHGAPLSSSAQSIRWTGPNSAASERGFSVDGMNVHVVPEPSALLLSFIGVCTIIFATRSRRAAAKSCDSR